MKKFFSAILLMTMMVFSVGTFVSCNDLVNEIEDVKGQTTELQAAIAELEGDIATLETALQNAKKEAADAAAAAAADAKDAAAKAAALQAEVNALKTALETAKAALDGKADKTAVDAVLAEIEALKAAIAGNASDVDALKAKAKLLEDALAEYKTNLENLGLEDEKLQAAIADLEAKMQAADEANAEAIADLVKELEEAVAGVNKNLVSYNDVIEGIVEMIQSVVYVPENADGTMVATGYELGDKKSDLFVKATYEVTPAKYAAELTNANVKFTTVPVTKAEAAEVIAAEIVEAKDGRVTLYARVNKNNKKTYEALTKNGAAALSLVITDEDTATVDSTDVTYGTNVKSAYTTVLPVDANGYVDVQDLVVVYNNVTNKEVTDKTLSNDALNSVDVPYTDFGVKSPLSVYELRVKMEGKYMTVDEAAKFVGYDITAKVTTNDPTYVSGSESVIKVTKADYASTFQLQLPQGVQNLTAYIGKAAAVTVTGVTVNDVTCPKAVGVKGKVVITYADASDVTFESYDAGAWSYTYYKGGQHVYNKSGLVRELDVTSSVNINDLTHGTTKLSDGAVITGVPMTAKYTVDGQEKQIAGTFSYKVLNSKSVMITAINLPIIDQALTYKANFTLADNANKLNYTASFTATVGARPADKEIALGDLTYTGKIKAGVEKSVNPIAGVLAVDGAYYADITSAQNALALLNGGFGTVSHDSKATAQLVDLGYKPVGMNYVESAKVTVASVKAYGTKYVVKTTVPFYGVNYTFTGSLTVNKPNYAIKASSLLINPSTMVGDIKGKVVYPAKATGSAVSAGSFDLQAIDLRDYVVVTENGANAVEDLLNSGEFELKYELISKYDDDRKPNTPEVVIPGFYFNGTAQSGANPYEQLGSGLNVANNVTWPTAGYASAKFRVTLVAVNGAEVAGPNNTKVADNFGSVEFTLQIPDLVKMTANTKVETKEFVPGVDQVAIINVCKGISVVDFNGKTLIGKKAKDLTTLWDETEGGKQFLMYGQKVTLSDDQGVVPTAVVESTGDALYYGKDFEVAANGDVKLLATDLNIQSNVVVTVPLKLTHDYQDATDKHTVNVTVKFTPKK